MEEQKKVAYFLGGNADGQTKEISEVHSRIHSKGSLYLSSGLLDIKQYGTVQIYVAEAMDFDEERREISRLSKS